jgi:hypothetical protein
MLQTLAKWGNIAFPAQLIPLLVGVLSFARVLWLILSDWVESREGKDASNEEQVSTRHARGTKFLRGIIRLLPPWTDAPPRGRPVVVGHVDKRDRHKPIHYRYLVGYLPWLSVFPFWKRELRDIENPSAQETLKEEAEVRNADASLNDQQVSQKLD